jgi:hypothetical protein
MLPRPRSLDARVPTTGVDGVVFKGHRFRRSLGVNAHVQVKGLDEEHGETAYAFD